MPLLLDAPALAAFATGTTEFVVGPLPTLSHALSAPVPTAGHLMTGYAVGVAIGGPLLALATRRLPPRPTLIGLMTLFSAGHPVMAAAPDFTVLLIAWLVTASTDWAFFSTGSLVAATVSQDRCGRAITLMCTDLTVIGIPSGTLLGQHPSRWAPFTAVALLSAVATLALYRLPPRHQPAPAADRPAAIPRPAPAPLALATTVLG
ncbi:MFS transporter [Streptomyces sp. NPDC017868]|uniref:MFS transporter n=1 Tax=Streptomyces sp. NPDC017868 TaxID=3365014 RepID=UPI0037925AE0